MNCKLTRTDVRPKVRRSLYFDSKVPIHLADDLGRMTNSEMCVLRASAVHKSNAHPPEPLIHDAGCDIATFSPK